MKHSAILITVFFVFLLICSHTYSITIKIGSLAPSGSPWDKGLKQIAYEWEKVSKGGVILKIYPGGIVGDESVMIRKMRLRQLQAAAITGVGMNQIAKGVLALSVPLLIRTDEELDYALKKMSPYFEEEIKKKQFIVVMWTFAGWTHFYSRKPVINTDDLKKQKLWIWEDNARECQIWKEAGYQPVPLAMPDVLTSLQSGMLDAFTATPLSAAAYQWFGIAKNMLDMNWAPMIAGIVISKNIWEKIPDELKSRLLEITKEVGENTTREMQSADKDAIQIMKQHGLNINNLPDEALGSWESLVKNELNSLIEEEFGKEAYLEIKKHIETFRNSAQSNGEK